MNINKLEEKLQELGQPAFRMKQIQKAVFQDGVESWDGVSTISKDLREILKKNVSILSFDVEKVLEAKDGQSVKALLKLADGNLIETVLISPIPDTWSACISCQVGCPMGCQFCATGKLGLKRNLTAEEITDQVLFWKQWLTKTQKDKAQSTNKTQTNYKPQTISTIVYMGMGEPFLNWDNVRESLENLINPELFGFGSRSISVSTAGIPEGIEKLAEEFPQVNLALSLHFADDQKRSEIMPINRKNNLEALKKSLQNYFAKTKRKVFLEYVMLQEINDTREDADKLVRFVKSIGKLQLLHVNLIRYNSTGSDFKASSKERTNTFKEYLLQNHIPVTIRKSLGEEIQGACGQLAGK
ncbi:MAG: 23S rRNA (adenine(2503)-C(2))-methyltransferase RlmN [Parcubacteria group bacterium]|jgi:23S rRNA (adenine(2503)-C(2))-methyltransferase